MEGDVIGYDPGGNNSHGVARLAVKNGKVTTCAIATPHDTEAAIAWLASGAEPLGAGIDTLTLWSTGRSGWRPADRELRNRYSKVQSSVMAPNALPGAMCLNGMIVMAELRDRWPDLKVTETHPKVLYHALTRRKHDGGSRAMRRWLVEQLGCDVSTANDHEWDAAVSAYAMLQGLLGRWKTDLHRDAKTEKGERLVRPAGPSFFYWPHWFAD